jgi:L-amino acid N-acyltransferase YncA
MNIRTATPDDAEALLSIYRPYVEHTAISFEYEVPSVEEFRQRIVDHLEHFPYLVAEEGDRILGYAYVGKFQERAAYQWSVETSIYVAQGLHRQGIGSRLLTALEEACRDKGIQNMYACISYVEPEDEYLTHDSVLFHERMGYRMVGRFLKCGRKFGRWYDIVWMEKLIGNHPSSL